MGQSRANEHVSIWNSYVGLRTSEHMWKYKVRLFGTHRFAVFFPGYFSWSICKKNNLQLALQDIDNLKPDDFWKPPKKPTSAICSVSLRMPCVFHLQAHRLSFVVCKRCIIKPLDFNSWNSASLENQLQSYASVATVLALARHGFRGTARRIQPLHDWRLGSSVAVLRWVRWVWTGLESSQPEAVKERFVEDRSQVIITDTVWFWMKNLRKHFHFPGSHVFFVFHHG